MSPSWSASLFFRKVFFFFSFPENLFFFLRPSHKQSLYSKRAELKRKKGQKKSVQRAKGILTLKSGLQKMVFIDKCCCISSPVMGAEIQWSSPKPAGVFNRETHD